MVRGIDTFKEFFKGFEDNYVIIKVFIASKKTANKATIFNRMG